VRLPGPRVEEAACDDPAYPAAASKLRELAGYAAAAAVLEGAPDEAAKASGVGTAGELAAAGATAAM
jgi:hypothetical protein